MTAATTALRGTDRQRLLLRLRELDDLDRLLHERGQQQPPPVDCMRRAAAASPPPKEVSMSLTVEPVFDDSPVCARCRRAEDYGDDLILYWRSPAGIVCGGCLTPGGTGGAAADPRIQTMAERLGLAPQDGALPDLGPAAMLWAVLAVEDEEGRE